MFPSGAKIAMLDTGFLFAFFDLRDQWHKEAVKRSDLIESFRLVIPWPCLYETVNTKFVKEPARVRKFELLIKRPEVILIDDERYRSSAFEMTIESARGGLRRISLTDMVMRLMLDDVNLRVGSLFTFNPGDFEDICRRRGIELNPN